MAAPPVDFLNSFFWQFTTLLVAVIAVIGFLVLWFYIMPQISRQFTSAKWKKGPVGFVQDDANVVHLVVSQAALPEGVIKTKRGFFLLSRAPYIGDVVSRRGRGRPPKDEVEESTNGLSDDHNAALKCALQTPVLAGFGKAVFFGYDGAPLVSNLKSLSVITNNAVAVGEAKDDGKGKVQKVFEKITAHADLRAMKEVIPATISRTQLANLFKYAETKGLVKAGKDPVKLILYAIAAAVPLGVMGLVVFLLING